MDEIAKGRNPSDEREGEPRRNARDQATSHASDEQAGAQVLEWGTPYALCLLLE